MTRTLLVAVVVGSTVGFGIAAASQSRTPWVIAGASAILALCLLVVVLLGSRRP